MDIKFNAFVAATYLGNDEVQEDNAGHGNDTKPDEPIDDVFEWIKKDGCLEIKVAKRDSCYSEYMLQEVRQMLVLIVGIDGILSDLSYLWI